MKNDRIQEEFTAMVRRMDGIIAKISVLFSDRTADGIRDLYQDIVCALWHSYPRFRHSSAESTWVYRVALNTALLHRRGRGDRKHRIYRLRYQAGEKNFHSHVNICQKIAFNIVEGVFFEFKEKKRIFATRNK